jgi:ribosomal protein S12 methylthiotransferase accessory factor
VLADGAPRGTEAVGGGVVTAVRLRSRPPTPLAESLPRLETLVSPYTGIVRRVDEHLLGADDARLIRVGTKLADANLLTGSVRGPSDPGTGGWAERALRAHASALGEAAERYAASFAPDESVLATADELGPSAVDPARFALFAPWQHGVRGFAYVPFTRGTPIRWVRGFRLSDAAEAWLPAQLVYLAWRRATGEAPIGYATSSGLACGPTLEEAVVGALLEAIERDAFMLAWTNRLSLPLLEWGEDPELAEFEASYLASAGGDHAVADLSVFMDVPVALGVVRGDGASEPAVAIGAGSAPTAAAAVKKALAEAYAVRTWGRLLMLTEPPPAPEDAITSFADHIRFYTTASNARAAAFLVASSERRRVAEVPALTGTTPLAQIEELVERLARRGLTAYAVDVTSSDVAEAGLAVVKAIVPELCGLDVIHHCRFLGGARLYRAPYELGLTDAPLRPEDVNPFPHPFP